MKMNNELKIEEYRALLEENRKNRSYIFERPFVILGLVGIVLSVSIGYEYSRLIYPFLILTLSYNLWFIADRLRSSARVVSYVQLFHEGDLKSKWAGWETSLRKYRIWQSENKSEKEKIQDELNRRIDPKATYRRIWFFWGIWLFHIFISVIIAAIGANTCYGIRDRFSVFYLLFLGASFFTFGILCVYVFPKKQKRLIEFERAVWLSVFAVNPSERKA